MLEWMQANTIPLALVAIIVGVLLTIIVFSRRRNFGRGRLKGTAADPSEVRRENPPD
jgi:hypothetical protein